MKRKRCFKCNKVRVLTKFYAHPMMADGHLNKCKDCTKRDVSARYRVTKPARQAYDLARNKTPKRKAQMIASTWRFIHRHPKKYRARNMTSAAIRDGKLIRGPCEVCGGKAEAHHDDYSKPLEVRWLCFAHHREHHGQGPF